MTDITDMTSQKKVDSEANSRLGVTMVRVGVKGYKIPGIQRDTIKKPIDDIVTIFLQKKIVAKQKKTAPQSWTLTEIQQK